MQQLWGISGQPQNFSRSFEEMVSRSVGPLLWEGDEIIFVALSGVQRLFKKLPLFKKCSPTTRPTRYALHLVVLIRVCMQFPIIIRITQLRNNRLRLQCNCARLGSYPFVLKLKLFHHFLLDRPENFWRVTQVFMLQKSVCRFLIAASGD